VEKRKLDHVLMYLFLVIHTFYPHAKQMVFLVVIDFVRTIDPFPCINDAPCELFRR